jgi:sec-independent protein translocase protein TatA
MPIDITGGHLPLAFLQMIGTTEWIVIGVVCVLLFGKRLPEVGRSLGRSFVEFKKGLTDVQKEVAETSETAKNAVNPAVPLAEEKKDNGTE